MTSQHRLITLPERRDQRGALVFGQERDHFPFLVKRFFCLYDIADGSMRGGHAHHQQHQLLVMLAGNATITVDNGSSRVPVRLERPSMALHVPPMLWLDLEDFTAGAICMVLASGPYDESDYIRSRERFLELTKS